MTFEDWTEVMYETMEVHPLSWMYYLSFIFLTTFAFLNMVIGIVVNVMENEHAQEKKLLDLEQGIPTITDLHSEIKELKALIIAQQQLNPVQPLAIDNIEDKQQAKS